MGYWRQGAAERLDNPPPGNQKSLVVKDKVSLGRASPRNVAVQTHHIPRNVILFPLSTLTLLAWQQGTWPVIS